MTTTRLLGCNPSPPDPRDLKLASYLDKPKLIEAIQAPRLHSWAAFPLPSGTRPACDRDPLYNNVAGCCTFSMGGHWANLVAQHTGRPLIVTADMVRDAYTSTGYNPITGAGDNGANIREDLLKPWKAMGWWGTKLLAYAAINKDDEEEVALAGWLGCGTLGGYALPLVSQSQADAKGRMQWTEPEGGFPPGQGPGTWGNHAIYTPAERAGNSWGDEVVMDRPWLVKCCFERWFGLLDIWQLGFSAPNGFDWQQLLSDAEARSTL
jgi:hypothetical protein